MLSSINYSLQRCLWVADGILETRIQFRLAVIRIQVLTALLWHGNHGTNYIATSPSKLDLDEGPFLNFHCTKYENKHGWEAPRVTAG